MRLDEGHDRISDARRERGAKRVWKNYSTGGSRGIRESNQYVREGGAMAREMLIAAAAAEWKVPATECSAANSVITHKPSGKKVGFGKVAAAAAKLEPPKEVKLKDPKDWKIAGKPIKRLDTLDKVTGKQIYGIDFNLPGMLTAAVKACPVNGGKLKSFDAAKVEKMPGREEGRGDRRQRRRGRGRHLLERPHRARGPAGRMGCRQDRRGPAGKTSPPC